MKPLHINLYWMFVAVCATGPQLLLVSLVAGSC